MKAVGGVTAALALVTIVMTWPLTARLSSRLPGGDDPPLVAVWAMGWSLRAFDAALRDPSTLSRVWDGNIFHPEPLSLAYTEPSFGLAILAWPIHGLTGNLILGYNLTHLATFVIGGLGMFLLVRALVDMAGAAAESRVSGVLGGLVAALVMAFSGARLTADAGQLQAPAFHWLPWALLGVHRYLTTDSRWALAGAMIALAAQSLSSIANAKAAALLVATFELIELIRLGRWREPRVWLELWAGAAAVAVTCLPVVSPYIAVRGELGLAHGVARVGPVCLAVLAGLGASRLARWPARITLPLLGITMVGYLWLVRPDAFPPDRDAGVSSGLNSPSAELIPSPAAPAIYRHVQQLTSDAVVLEFPFGAPAYERRYMFFAALHGRRLVNGDGALLPAGYVARRQVLTSPLLDPERAARALGGATHVIVHGRAWSDDTAARVAQWLESLGGRLIARSEETSLYQIQTTERLALIVPPPGSPVGVGPVPQAASE